MPRQILVIEYEPRYTQRIQDALVGSPFSATVVRTGEDARGSLETGGFELVVLSTIIPRFSTSDLIEMIHRAAGQDQKILLTTSGYSGTDPRTDAEKLGGTDMLLKPYTSDDFLAKVRDLLGDGAADAEGSETTVQVPKEKLKREVAAPKPSAESPTVEKPLDLGTADPVAPTEKHRKVSLSDVDKLLEDTLSGVRIPNLKTIEEKKKKEEAKKRQEAKDVDKLLEDTLSGLESKMEEESASPDEDEAPAEPSVSSADQSEPAAAQGADEPPFEEEPPFAEEAPFEESEPLEHAPLELGGDEEAQQYTFVEKIATGGMAEVWKARMQGLEGFEKIVAIKKILPHLSDNQEFIEMFVDEAKLAAQLNHNNIIHIYDLGKQEDSWYIAMEYIDGDDLKSLLKKAWERDRPLPVPLALFIASKISWALDYAHRKRGFEDEELRLVHRDVSPQNVLISTDGDIKLCDFGIAKAASKASHTQAGVLKGKLQYMSPEQAWGKPIDQRSDIFATAAVLFEMLSGRKLFTGDSEISVLDQVREARVPAPSLYNPEVSERIDEIVLRGLEKDPDDRYQSAAEMARDIDGEMFAFKPAPTNVDLAAYVAQLESADRVPTMERPIPTKQQPPALAGMDADEPSPHQVVPPAEIDGAEEVAIGTGSLAETGVGGTAEGPADLDVEEPDFATAPIPVDAGLEKKPSKLPLIAALLVFGLLAGAAGAWYMWGGGEEEPEVAGESIADGAIETSAPETIETPAPAPAALTEEALAVEGLDGEDVVESVDEPELTDEDRALIDRQVQERLERDRRRLEAQRRAASQPEPPPARTKEPAPTRPEPRAPEPEPVEESPAEPVVTEPETEPERGGATETGSVPETVPETAPTEPAAEPEVEAVRRGDFVAPGTPGLVDPEILSLGRVRYPPLARRNKIEGVVIIRALVSEDGEVLETEVLRSAGGNFGLTEAATAAVSQGKFRPATKDGVAVRAYKTITVPFRL